ncbi:ABC transporter ATP-binding protein [Enterococcus columbae]|uniref:ABC transporter ATP-binding protein n=1 Tax=Enterococcus columbae DSM 7374 = ATCC 51263 TaxID=1121865 RepID=S0KYG2_9ENTE|nr:ABC transporter ATP-binding protein [Enterococcus columbae]EOT44306.1 ABC transporter ATP-binding protein [Enterococcus columbae DSM 7374 = ATCC 51263]EOW84464.1 ABC transporter ATP-binding protein [Enterococcus columbae DSM 7374 = ATCC 51263]
MLTVRNLTKTFGNYKALDQLSFTIQPGSILGLIGQNGAGKTTTFRLILDFIQADMGTVLWNGQPIGEADYDRIGYLPEERGLYPKLTIEEQLLFFAELRGKSRKEIAPQIDAWLEKFQVKGKKTDKIQTLSKGNQQKVQLIATLIHQPQLVILDEPFSGLDPVNAQLMKDAIIELRKLNACVIFSSHNMDNVEQICDQLIMLKNGKTVLNGTVQSIRESFGKTRLYLQGESLDEEQLRLHSGVVALARREDQSLVLKLADAEVGKEIFSLVTQNGYLPMFNQQPPTLEEIFKMKAGEKDE